MPCEFSTSSLWPLIRYLQNAPIYHGCHFEIPNLSEKSLQVQLDYCVIINHIQKAWKQICLHICDQMKREMREVQLVLLSFLLETMLIWAHFILKVWFLTATSRVISGQSLLFNNSCEILLIFWFWLIGVVACHYLWLMLCVLTHYYKTQIRVVSGPN